MRQIPNIITLTNLLLGCIAFVEVIQGRPANAAMIIGLCSIMDYLDGAAARLLKAWSPLGQQLDSLADLVSFGVVPAAIIYQYLQNSVQSLNHGVAQIVLPGVAFFITVFSALRLAKFNLETRQEDDFKGLPTPANALLIASVPFTLAFTSPDHPVHQALTVFTGSIAWLLGFTALVSWLMVSNIRMFSLKVKSFSWQQNKFRYVFLGGCLLLLVILGISALPFFLIFYLLLSLVYHKSIKKN